MRTLTCRHPAHACARWSAPPGPCGASSLAGAGIDAGQLPVDPAARAGCSAIAQWSATICSIRTSRRTRATSPRRAPTARRVVVRGPAAPAHAPAARVCTDCGDRCRRLEPAARRWPRAESRGRPASGRGRRGCRVRSGSTPQAGRSAAAPRGSAGLWASSSSACSARSWACRTFDPASVIAQKPSV